MTAYVTEPRLCEVCKQRVTSTGPWCDLYCKEFKRACWHMLHDELEEADATGDGSMVNALCEYGRSLYGACLHW